jgi:hypothetical protein
VDLVGYFVIKGQERNQRIQEKIDAANFWLLAASNSLNILCGIKTSYIDTLTDDPLQRLTIPSMSGLPLPTKLEINITNIAFVARTSKVDKVNKKVSFDEEDTGFNGLIRISSAFQNYNILMDNWAGRNTLWLDVLGKIEKDHGAFHNEIFLDLKTIFQCIGRVKFFFGS